LGSEPYVASQYKDLSDFGPIQVRSVAILS
jgi:hypothetical protein